MGAVIIGNRERGTPWNGIAIRVIRKRCKYYVFHIVYMYGIEMSICHSIVSSVHIYIYIFFHVTIEQI